MNILISFPRSGSSLLRYVLEEITQSQTIDGADNSNLHQFYKKTLKNDSILLYRYHFIEDIQEKHKFVDNRIVYIYRDPKKSIVSHCLRNNKVLVKEEIVYAIKKYNEIFNFFMQYKGKKIVIRYSDLISNCSNIVKEIITFFIPEYKEELDEEKVKKIQIEFWEMYKEKMGANTYGKNNIKYEEILESVKPSLNELFDAQSKTIKSIIKELPEYSFLSNI